MILWADWLRIYRPLGYLPGIEPQAPLGVNPGRQRPEHRSLEKKQEHSLPLRTEKTECLHLSRLAKVKP